MNDGKLVLDVQSSTGKFRVRSESDAVPHTGSARASGERNPHDVALRVLSMRFMKGQGEIAGRLADMPRGRGPGELMLLPPAPAGEPKPPSPRPKDCFSAGKSAGDRTLPFLPDRSGVPDAGHLCFLQTGRRARSSAMATGWHIRTGEWILAHHQVPHTGFFLFHAVPGHRGLRGNGCDLLFAMLHQRWGMAAVVLASLIVICFTTVGVFRLIRRECNNGLGYGRDPYWRRGPAPFVSARTAPSFTSQRRHCAHNGALRARDWKPGPQRSTQDRGRWRGWYRSRCSGPICMAAFSWSSWCWPAISVRTC